MKSLSLILLLLSILFIAEGQVNNNTPASKEDIINLVFQNEGEKFFRFQVENKSDISGLSRIISIDKVGKDGYVYAYANRKEFSGFLDQGIPYEVLRHPGIFEGYLNMKDKVDIRDILEWDFYPTYDAYVDMMHQFAEQYPELCQVTSFGTTNQGRQLLAVKISDNIGISENEPQFLYTSSIHGDEITGYVLMLRLIDYLLSNYDNDPRIKNMVDNIEIWINPLANPDGTYRGGNNTVNGAYRYNANWIDLNRNYPDPEDGPHPDGEDWQIETQRFMELAEANHFVSSANLHGGEDVLNYPWDTWSRLSADDAWWQYVCHEYADTVHANCPWEYMSDFDNGITNGYAWYTISGGRQDYMNFFHQCREFTLEISDTKLMEPDSLPYYWDYNYRSLLNYMEQVMYGVRGTVKDSVTGWPVEAEVYVVLHEMDSSWVYSKLPNGNYSRLLHSGTYTLRFSAEGYLTKFVQNVNVSNRQATVLDVILVPEEYAIVDNNLISSIVQTFPNPLTGNTLHYNSTCNVSNIRIFTISGKEIGHFQADRQAGEISLESVSPGMYFIWFETEKGQGVKKLVRE
jgi:hypothetical protein